MDNIQISNIIDPLMTEGFSTEHYDDFVETITSSGISVREFKSVLDSAVIYRPRDQRTFDSIQSLADALFDEADAQELHNTSAAWNGLITDLFDLSKRPSSESETTVYTSGVPTVKAGISDLQNVAALLALI
jgi:hypothetical protein